MARWRQSRSSIDSILCSNLFAHIVEPLDILQSTEMSFGTWSLGPRYITKKNCCLNRALAWTLKSYKRQCRECGKGGASPAFFPSRASHLLSLPLTMQSIFRASALRAVARPSRAFAPRLATLNRAWQIRTLVSTYRTPGQGRATPDKPHFLCFLTADL